MESHPSIDIIIISPYSLHAFIHLCIHCLSQGLVYHRLLKETEVTKLAGLLPANVSSSCHQTLSTSSITSFPIYVCTPIYSFRQHSFIYEVLVTSTGAVYDSEQYRNDFCFHWEIRYKVERKDSERISKNKCTYFLYSTFLFCYSPFKNNWAST